MKDERNALTYRGNTLYLKGMLENLDQCDMLAKTGESNTIGWILGHITLYRGQLLKIINADCTIEESENRFARGAKKDTDIEINMQHALDRFIQRGEMLVKSIPELTDEQLHRDTGIQVPLGGSQVKDIIGMLAWHETFHLGQIDLIKAANGKGGIK